MGLTNISFRTIKRKKSRAALTILCVVIGVAVFSGANVGADGVENAYVTQLLSTFGDVDISVQNSTSLFLINYNQSLLDEMEGIIHIDSVSPRLTQPTQTFWFNGTGNNTIFLYAIDPDLDSEFGEVYPPEILNQLENNNTVINEITADIYNLTKNQEIWFYNPYFGINESIKILEIASFSGKFTLE